MTSSLVRELDVLGADTDSVHHALRYYLAERLDDLTPEDMLEQLRMVADPSRVDAALTGLREDARLLENGALLILSAAWADEAERDRVRAVLGETKGKLPIVEVAALAIVCMYGLHLLATGGIKKSEKTIIRNPDGSFKITETTEYLDPGRPFGAIVELFRPKR